CVGDLTTVEHHVRLAFNLAARHAIEMWNGWAQCFEGVVLIKRGESHAGSQLLQSALERLPAPGFHHHVSLLLPELAAGLGGAGQIAEGLVVADTALARAEQAEAGWCLAELLRTKGELLLLGGAPTAVATAEACFQQALDVARRQGALSWELRAPKAFDVLRYLVEHPGRLVAHDELLEALWTKTYVQPEVLKSHIASIRAVLGDDARRPRFIETLSRRGYRFIAAVTEGEPASHG